MKPLYSWQADVFGSWELWRETMRERHLHAHSWNEAEYGPYEDWDKAGKPKCIRNHPQTRKTRGKSGCKICDRELHRAKRAKAKI